MKRAQRSASVPASIAAALVLAATAAGCATTPDPAARDRAAAGPREPTPDLPAIPAVRGPLELRVSYPRDSARITTRGDNFIFGSTGDGRARLWINDREVELAPNGGFLSFQPVPQDGVYRLRAERDGETATLEVPVRLPEPPPPPTDTATILAGSAYPTGGWVALPGERIDVGFRGTAGGTATVILPDGSRVPLLEEPAEARERGATDFEVNPADPAGAEPRERAYSWYRGFFTARRVVTADTTVAWPGLTGEARPEPGPTPPGDPAEPGHPTPGERDPRQRTAERREAEQRPLGQPLGQPAGAQPDVAPRAAEAGPSGARDGVDGAAVLELVAGGTTTRHTLPFNLVLADPERPRVGVAHDPRPPEENGDAAIIARPGPGGGPYHYTWANGTEMTLTGERNGVYRVRLAGDLDAWSPAGDVQLRAAGAPPPESRAATVRMDPQPTHIDVHVNLDRRLPYAVEETDRSLSLVVYGALSRVNFLQHGRVDPYIVRGEWAQPTNDRFIVRVHLAGAPWGYETFWAEGDDLVLRIRRPPAIDAAAPLRGLRVGIDPGHGGADRFTMGPTGYTEADANLAISLVLRDVLERRGAEVVMSRMTDTTVSLVERTELARREDVDLWVSVHNNAFPDGVNPWENNGTSVYYNHARAAGLAWAVQEELLDELGLRDLGVGRADLHQARFTWAPSILTEIMFMMIPEQEAALQDDRVRRRIAEAHARGMERWLRAYAADRDRR